jgi:N-acetylglucosaminyl-diphospho-decaprenol L-rhamnosyltransferase
LVDLSICIVNWNTEAVLRECLGSVGQQTRGISYEIFVVDNASKDGSVEMVRSVFPGVCLIVNEENRGFAAANNQAVRSAKGRYILFLNPDTVVHNGALKTMVQFMERHPEAGALGCKLLNEDGSVQHSIRQSPSFSVALLESTILRHVPFFRGRVGNFKTKGFSFDKTKEVDAVCGAALLVRKGILDDVGLMDEAYFMFVEELDLCQRIRAKGHKVYFTPKARITHLGGESRNQNPEGLMIAGLKSLFRYFNKFEGPRKTFLFKVFYKPLFLSGLILDLMFDSLGVVKYKTIRKNPLKANKRTAKIQGVLNFLRKDLGYFLFDL